MTDVSEFSALNWVKDELDETVRKARRALEAYVESEGDNTELDTCADHLHQIAGVLQVVQIYGPGMLAEEMEAVARAMKDGHVRQTQDAAEALMLALIQLPDYLEKLQAGNADVPLIILPLLNDLRAVRDAPLLSEAALFRPGIHDAPIAEHLNGEPNQQLPALVRRLRQKFHVGLLGWFRQKQVERGWQQLVKVFDELEKNSGTPQFYKLAWVSGALIRGLIDNSITSGIAVKQLFSKVDRQLKRIIDEGETAQNDEQADDLLQNLLYYIAQADTDNPRIIAVKEAFDLDNLLPSEAELTQGRQGLSGSNAELAASISDAVQKELTRIKDVLDLFMRKQDAEPGMLEHLEKPLRQLADTLGMVGQGSLRSRLLRQANKVQGFLEKDTPPEEYELMEMAGDILFVESSLSTLQTIQPSESVDTEVDEKWGIGLPESEYQNLIKQTVREAKVDIAKAKEAIISYTEAPSEPDILKKVFEGFQRVYGALKVLELTESAQILYKTADFIKQYMFDDQQVVDRQQLNFLADVISSIEYYLEALVDGTGNRREIMAIAQSALNGLLQSRSELESAQNVVESIPLVDSQPAESEQVDVSQADSGTLSEAEKIQAKEIVKETEDLSEIPIPASEKPPLEDIDAEILEIFVEEAREELESIRQDLPAWLKNKDDKDSLNSFRRSFHTLKGSGRLVGAKIIGEVAWSVENMLNRVIDETIHPSSEMRELLEHVIRILPVLIDCQENNVHPDADVDVDGFIQRAFAITDGRIQDEQRLDTGSKEKSEEHEDQLDSLQIDQSSDYELGLSSKLSSESDETDIDLTGIDISEPLLDSSDLLPESDLQNEEDMIIQQGFSDSDLMIEVDTELLDVFAEESQNHLADLEEFISLAKSSDPRPQISDDIVRAFHTLHGSARMTGITPIANLSKSVEEYLKILVAKDKLADDGVLALLEGSISSVRKFLTWLPLENNPESDADSYLVRLTTAKEELISEGKDETQLTTRDIASIANTDETGLDKASQLKEPAKGFTEADAVDVDIPSSLQDEKVFTVDEDPELVGIFQEEAGELLEGITSSFDAWLKDQDKDTQLEIIQRGLHTLKGSARLAGIMPIGDLAYALEKIFSASLDITTQAFEPLVDMLKQALNSLAVQIKETEAFGAVHWADSHINYLEACFEDLRESSSDNTVSEDDQGLGKAGHDEVDATDTAQIGLPETGDEEASGSAGQEENLSEFYAEPVSYLADDDLFVVGEDPELLEIFFEESRDLIDALENCYQNFGVEADSTNNIPEIQRILHTLKGSARLAGVLPVGDLSHALESYFKDLEDGKSEISEVGMQVIRQSIDMLATQIDEAESLGQVHRPSALAEQLESLLKPAESDDVSTSFIEKSELSETIFEYDETGEDTSSDIFFEPLSYLQDGEFVEIGEDPELIEVFCEEAKEILEHLESAYQNWMAKQDDLSFVGDIQRSLHTLKGSARLAGISPVGDLSHAVESFLTWVVADSGRVSHSILNLTRQAMDSLASQIDDISSIGKVALADDLQQELEDFVNPNIESGPAESDIKLPKKAKASKKKKSSADSQTESAVVLPFVSEIAKRVETRKKSDKKTPFKTSKDQVRISADLMDRLVNNAGEVSIYRARLEQQNNVLGFNLSELEQTVSRLHTQLRNLEIETEAQILYRWERDSEKDDREKAAFDPLELDRFSNMQQLSRALVETVSDLGSINQSLTDLQRETDTLLLQQSRISTDLQDGLLRTRMVPFANLIPRMQRLVRQTADQTGKKAHLESFGIEGELDRNILNRMVPVFEHLLRNAVSHGIEAPAERPAVDKDETGRISLYIDREANNVLITISDDGRGLDIEAIRTQAIKQGMINQTAEVSDDDLIQCVLNPGFSTAKEITQIAGRGVGLDVVASEVKQLGGGLEIDSQPGRGTSFIIRLPLTLAISDALLVRVGEEIYAIPHGSVEGVVRIRNNELQACYSGEQEHYTYANRNYKTAYLGRMMGLENHELSDSVRWFPLLLVHAGEHNVAMQVDELLGTRQIVVKSIGKQAGSVRWITGGTILADGRVSLILDVGALVRMDAARLPSSAPLYSVIQEPTRDRIQVMVVDDSITVRKVTGRLLERHDMDVVAAKDGVEAVALLQDQVPDIMLLDIEMPRMDGFEVARHINNSIDYYGLPIIMISSRVGEKHRQRAFDLGVKRCLGKPYQEAELLDNINEVLAEIKS
ncbi:MAG: Hpt domain-containing protein [Pseudomonadota bacterium]